MNLYVASSWRNNRQPGVVRLLRRHGHDVYDFKNPPHGNGGFVWSDIDRNWKHWTNEEYREALNDPIARAGFKSDFDAMQWADACVMVLPCGRSAHLECGWFAGEGKPTAILMAEMEPELMVLMCDAICLNAMEVIEWLDTLENPRAK